jgi:type II secretory pathway component GspD/PulD (secretin)
VFSSFAFAAEDKAAAMRKSSLELIDVGNALYSRGMYSAAEQSLLRASENKKFLSESEQKKLGDSLDKAHLAVAERQKIFTQVKAADALAKSKDFSGAAAKLAAVRNSPYLTKVEKGTIESDIKAYQSQAQETAAKEKPAPANETPVEEAPAQEQKPVEQPAQAAQAQPATEPDTAVAQEPAAKVTPEVNQTPAQQAVEPAPAAEKAPVAETPAPAPAAVPAADTNASPAPVAAAAPAADTNASPAVRSESYSDRVMQQRSIQRGYTEAVVDDAINKSRTQAANGQFEAARESLSSANRLVENNRPLLAEDDYKNFVSRLLAERTAVDAKAAASAETEQRNQQLQATTLQNQLRTQQEIERTQRITDLMNKAVALEREQRYEDSLAQLDLLLAIDPLNEQAKVMHQNLEDMISYRKQLETKNEIDKQTLETFLNADRANIPHSEEMTYPRDWRDIVNKRNTEETGGMSKEDVAVSKQLEMTVDLSKFNPDMTFGEAIELLKGSVDPALRIVPLWKDLQENAEIDRTTKINMEPVSSIPVGRALDLLLNSVSGGLVKLGYVIQDGVITIATQASLPTESVQRMYDITDLLDLPAQFETDLDTAGLGEVQQVGGTGGGGSSGRTRTQSTQQQQQEQGPEAQAGRIQDIMTLIQETVEPDSWFINGGEGTIQVYSKKLIVSQTPDVHRKIAKLIDDLRANLGQQISIEARFLLVDENFLEDIGVDMDFTINSGRWLKGSKWSPINVDQDSIGNTTNPGGTRVPSSLGGLDMTATPPAMTLSTSYGSILDDLQVDFLLKATQTHRNSRSLEAPRLTVLSGETATLNISTDRNYISNVEFEQSSTTGDSPIQFITSTRIISSVSSGAIMMITPTITANKKYVLLRIETKTSELLALDQFTAATVSNEGTELTEPFFIPTMEITEIRTRVNVPDGGTLLLGGQKLTGEVEKESGVPGLSKIPVLGRLFSNRSTVKDHRVLLILVTPTIILQDEREAEAVAGLKNNSMQ